jgi:hypothetical protein
VLVGWMSNCCGVGVGFGKLLLGGRELWMEQGRKGGFQILYYEVNA